VSNRVVHGDVYLSRGRLEEIRFQNLNADLVRIFSFANIEFMG
jgi:hypothetical protein